ncbi:hypothetical protein [Desulfofundulus sp.]|uniref:hypothetical protein n=1 Tax=Desulfofundulus sp. TaxID=2282750 RepID=UPI003C74F251
MYKRLSLEYYFAGTGFSDLLPLALQMARELHFTREEMIEAICKVADKARMYPPTRNRQAWFAAVFREKLLEARAEIMALKKKYPYNRF